MTGNIHVGQSASLLHPGIAGEGTENSPWFYSKRLIYRFLPCQFGFLMFRLGPTKKRSMVCCSIIQYRAMVLMLYLVCLMCGRVTSSIAYHAWWIPTEPAFRCSRSCPHQLFYQVLRLGPLPRYLCWERVTWGRLRFWITPGGRGTMGWA